MSKPMWIGMILRKWPRSGLSIILVGSLNDGIPSIKLMVAMQPRQGKKRNSFITKPNNPGMKSTKKDRVDKTVKEKNEKNRWVKKYSRVKKG